MIALGATEISKVCLGSDELSKVCLGSTELWSAVQPLPYDYRVEWLKSNTRNYPIAIFDILGNMGTDAVEVTFINDSYANQDVYIGDVSNTDSRAIRLYVNGSGKYAFFYTTGGNNQTWNSTNVSVANDVQTTFKVDYKNGTWNIDNGTQYSGTFPGKAGNSFQNCIGMVYGNTKRTSLAKFKQAKWWRNDEIILNTYPVMKDNTPYFYNEVSNSLIELVVPVANVTVGPQIS